MRTLAVLEYPEIMDCGRKKRKEQMGIRDRKVRDIRRKIRSGKYDVSKGLDVVLDRLLEEMLK